MKQHEIVLSMFEAVVQGGVRRVSWQVSDGKRWVAAGQFPGARTESQQAMRGVVWQLHVVLMLPAGTRLLRLESQPELEPAADPLAYLWRRERGAKRRELRTYYQVSRAGSLERLPGPRGRSEP